MRSKDAGRWISLPLGNGKSVWLRLSWIRRLKVESQDRLSPHGPVVTVPWGELLYRPPGCEPEVYRLDRDELHLVEEILASRTSRRAG